MGYSLERAGQDVVVSAGGRESARAALHSG